GHAGTDSADKRFTRVQQFVERYFLLRHSVEPVLEVVGYVPQLRRKKLVRRMLVADQIDDQSRPYNVGQPFFREKQTNVKEVTRMLTIQSSHDFSGVQVCKGQHLHLSKAEGVFDVLSYSPNLRIVDAST